MKNGNNALGICSWVTWKAPANVSDILTMKMLVDLTAAFWSSKLANKSVGKWSDMLRALLRYKTIFSQCIILDDQKPISSSNSVQTT